MAACVLTLDTVTDKSSMFFLDATKPYCVYFCTSFALIKWTRGLKNEEANEEERIVQYTLITSHASAHDSYRRDTYVHGVWHVIYNNYEGVPISTFDENREHYCGECASSCNTVMDCCIVSRMLQRDRIYFSFF